jgi:hypothetical protein
MIRNHGLLRALLAFAGIYHVTVGLIANLSTESVQWMAGHLLGLQIRYNPQLFYIAKPFGVYVLCFGLLLLVAAWNPVKNRAVITVAAILFLVRALQRLLLAQQFETLFGVSPRRNWFFIAVVGLLALALLALRWNLYVQMHRQPTPGAATAAKA